MKIIFRLALIFAVFDAVYAVPAVVDYVVDGDTLAVHVNVADGVQVPVRVRLINIDTPELSGDCEAEIKMARRARGRMEKLLPRGARVDLENIKDDKYLGRIDANVVINGDDVGDILVREKLARRYNGGRRKSWCKK